MQTERQNELAKQIEKDLFQQFGSLLVPGTEAVSKVLGYPSQAAFRKALSAGTVPVHVFSLEHRRGKFAFVKDVAAWLAAQSVASEKAPRKPVTPLARP